ncbi:MAG TPA: MlaD family protein [Thermoleophilaceae bacterium]|nr:MlaD family protein [Thermoleophilaceae bacterium]
MRRRAAGRFTPLQAGLIALVVIVVAIFLAFTKDIPFTKPFEVNAVFENAPPIGKGTAVRIAGVDVGKVSGVDAAGGESQAVKVTIKLDDAALPLHEDATLKVRPRIFFEGNVFLDVRPGTPGRDEIEDGHTFPASQTSAPVQLDQVLGTLNTSTRKDLQDLLAGYGDAVGGEPQAGEDDDQDPSTEGQTAGESLNDSLEYSADALRGTAIVNQATLGRELHDLSKLIASQQKVSAALGSNEAQLKDLITNFNVTMGALASESTNLRETVRLLPRVLRAANPALDNLNAAFPPTRAWALEMIPGVRETPATIDAAFPWIRQTRALLSPAELQGLVDDLSPAVDDFTRFSVGQLRLLPEIDDFNRCQYEVVLPTGEQTIDDAHLSTGLQNYKEFWQVMVGLAGESQNFDGNGNYTRFQAGGGGSRVATGPVGRGGPLYANATAPPLGTRPTRTPKAPYRPGFKCHRGQPADLNAARIGGGP